MWASRCRIYLKHTYLFILFLHSGGDSKLHVYTAPVVDNPTAEPSLVPEEYAIPGMTLCTRDASCTGWVGKLRVGIPEET